MFEYFQNIYGNVTRSSDNSTSSDDETQQTELEASKDLVNFIEETDEQEQNDEKADIISEINNEPDLPAKAELDSVEQQLNIKNDDTSTNDDSSVNVTSNDNYTDTSNEDLTLLGAGKTNVEIYYSYSPNFISFFRLQNITIYNLEPFINSIIKQTYQNLPNEYITREELSKKIVSPIVHHITVMASKSPRMFFPVVLKSNDIYFDSFFEELTTTDKLHTYELIIINPDSQLVLERIKRDCTKSPFRSTLLKTSFLLVLNYIQTTEKDNSITITKEQLKAAFENFKSLFFSKTDFEQFVNIIINHMYVKPNIDAFRLSILNSDYKAKIIPISHDETPEKILEKIQNK